MIVLVTDSTAYLTQQEARKLGVIYVPMTYTVDGVLKTEGYIDEFTYDGSLNYKINDMKTSQPGMGRILNTFASLRASGHEILCVTLSSRLSGTFSNACVCAEELGKKSIRVVDSRMTAGGLFMLVRRARELIDAGGTLNDIADKLDTEKDRVHTYFSVRDLTPLRRSGRLGLVRQSVGTILNQRPILKIHDGAVVYYEVSRGLNEQLRKLAARVPENAEEIVVEYITEAQAANRLAEMLEKKCGANVQLRKVGPVLGIHLGFDVIGTSWKDAAEQ